MSEDTQLKRNKIIAIFKLAILVLIVVGVPAFVYVKYGAEIFSKDAAKEILQVLRSHRSESLAILIIIQAVQVIVCILPGQPIQIAGSYMFGIPGAMITSLVGAAIGVMVSFVISRLLGRSALQVLFGEDRIEYYSEKLNSSRGLLIVFLVYLIPGIPKDLMSYAAGISEIRFVPFIIVSTVGRAPGMMGSILLGYFYRNNDMTAIAILLAVSLLITVICIIKRRDILDLLDELAKRGAE